MKQRTPEEVAVFNQHLDDLNERFDQGRTAASSPLLIWSPRENTRFLGNSPPLPVWASSYHLRNIVMGSGVTESFLSTLTSMELNGEHLRRYGNAQLERCECSVADRASSSKLMFTETGDYS